MSRDHATSLGDRARLCQEEKQTQLNAFSTLGYIALGFNKILNKVWNVSIFLKSLRFFWWRTCHTDEIEDLLVPGIFGRCRY